MKTILTILGVGVLSFILLYLGFAFSLMECDVRKFSIGQRAFMSIITFALMLNVGVIVTNKENEKE